MKLLKTFILSLLFLTSSHAQTAWDFSRAVFTAGNAEVLGMSVEQSSGHLLSVGYYETNTATFQPTGTPVLASPGINPDGFVFKTDNQGNEIWSFRIGKLGGSTKCADVVADNLGNYYVIGTFQGNSEFQGNSGTSTALSSTSASWDAFLAKYDSGGNLLWVESLGNTGTESFESVHVSSNAVFVSGSFNSLNLLGVLNSGGNDGMVARYGLNGGLDWFTHFASMGADMGTAITSDDTNIYFGGSYSGILSIYTPGSTLALGGVANVGNDDAVLISLSEATGSYNWSTTFSSPGVDQLKEVDIQGTNLYAVGFGTNNINFPGFGNISGLIGEDPYLAKIDPTNGNATWALVEKGIISSNNDFFSDIEINDSGNVICSGSIDGSTEFSGLSNNHISIISDTYDPVLASYDGNGQLLWVRQNYTTSSDNQGLATAFWGDSVSYVGGYYNSFASTMNWDPADILPNGGGVNSGYFAKTSNANQEDNSCTLGNTENFPIGSWIIAMDNTYQPGTTYANEPLGYPDEGTGPGGTTPFNLYSYGLVNQLLQNEIPVYWAIASGKVKNGVDINTDAFQMFPTNLGSGSATNKNFIAGPFVIHPSDTAAARPIIQAFGNDVKVYETTVAIPSLEYRYKLTFKPNILLFDNGGIKNSEWQYEKHEKIYLMSGITNYTITSAGALNLDQSSCYTFASEAHWKDGEDVTTTPYGTDETKKVKEFVMGGGNFLAQCAGIEAYENYEFFHTTQGIHPEGDPYYGGGQKDGPHAEFNVDEPYFQIDGDLVNDPTGTFVGIGLNGGAYKDEVVHVCDKTPSGDEVAGFIQVVDEGQEGGYVFYLGGHDYRKRQGTSKPYDVTYVNGIRMLLNCVFIL